MKGRKHSPEQVVRMLTEADWLLAQGHTLAEVARYLGVTKPTYYRWRNQFGGLKNELKETVRKTVGGGLA
jgi:transposase-like protein